MTLGVYIQVPFCQTKCTYCNFHTGVVSRDRYAPYARAVCREIGQNDWCGGVADTIYFGGGTPSLLDPALLAEIVGATRSRFGHSLEIEVTLEVDPETITPEKASAWLAAGFNRISMGAQSFADVELRAAGRMHRRSDILQGVSALCAAGFSNISMDLIAGLPHQTCDSWNNSVTELLSLRPQHISIYMLEIDEGSRLGRESLAGGTRYSASEIPADDAIAEFYESAWKRLAAAGYDHYEISNWALPSFRSRHNLKYWRREPYLGFGAGAHSFDGRVRWANVHDPARYAAAIEMGSSPREQIEPVTSEQALDEEFFLGLRQLDGVDLDRISREYSANGLAKRVASLRARIEGLRSAGLVEMDGPHLRLAPERLSVSNEVFVELLG